jgi:hypothetical protein
MGAVWGGAEIALCEWADWYSFVKEIGAEIIQQNLVLTVEDRHEYLTRICLSFLVSSYPKIHTYICTVLSLVSLQVSISMLNTSEAWLCDEGVLYFSYCIFTIFMNKIRPAL